MTPPARFKALIAKRPQQTHSACRQLKYGAETKLDLHNFIEKCLNFFKIIDRFITISRYCQIASLHTSS